MTVPPNTNPLLSKLFLLPALLVALGTGCSNLQDEVDAPVEDKLNLGGCTKYQVVDDGEDNDHRVLVQSDRGGYMYTFVDDNGSTVQPTAGSQGGVFAFHVGGANGSMYGARFYGETAHADIIFAGFGMNLKEPKDGFDASKYEGITFFGRRAPDSFEKVRLKVPDRQTDPGGGVCTECFNDFGKDFVFTEQWKQYIVPFTEMQQMPDWGMPRPISIDPTALYAIQFQVATPGVYFDIWVDDISFYGCKPEDIEAPQSTEAGGAAAEETEEDENTENEAEGAAEAEENEAEAEPETEENE